jgi:hypothetical protein
MADHMMSNRCFREFANDQLQDALTLGRGTLHGVDIGRA